MCYRMSEISRHPVVAATRALRFADHVTKRNEGSGNENDTSFILSSIVSLIKSAVQLFLEKTSKERNGTDGTSFGFQEGTIRYGSSE